MTDKQTDDEFGDLADGWRWMFTPGSVLGLRLISPAGRLVAWITPDGRERADGVRTAHSIYRAFREAWCERYGWRVTSERETWCPRPMISVELVGGCMVDVLDEDCDESDIDPSWPEVVRNLVRDIYKEGGAS